MTPPKIRVKTEAVRAARREFRTFADDLDALRADVPLRCTDILGGMGQFQDSVIDGVNVFEASWLTVLEVSAASSGTVATNMGSMTLDLSKLDDL